MTGGDGTTSNFSSMAALQHERVDNDNSCGGEAGRDVLARKTRYQKTRSNSCSTTTRTTACSSARWWSEPPRRSGDSSAYFAQEDQEDGSRWRAQHGCHWQRREQVAANKTLETTIMISEEANPTGQRTRVMDMNMSLTF